MNCERTNLAFIVPYGNEDVEAITEKQRERERGKQWPLLVPNEASGQEESRIRDKRKCYASNKISSHSNHIEDGWKTGVWIILENVG